MEKLVRVRFRVTARGGVAVVMKAARQGQRRVTVGATSGSKYWEAELVKSRLRAIRKAVHGVELETNNDRASVAIDSDEEWFSAESE